MSNVIITSSSGVSLNLLLGQVSPVISDGVSTWDTVARPKREAVTRYTGRNPWKQDIAVVFDGWQDDTGQESRISKLVTMASQAHTISLDGQALLKELDWVIEGVDWDNQDTIWRMINGRSVRVRQFAVIHLLEYVKDAIVKTPAAPHTTEANKPVKKVTIPDGMILKKIAQIEYGDPDKWSVIRDANLGALIGAGPRTFVMKGITLIIPHGNKLPTYYTVP